MTQNDTEYGIQDTGDRTMADPLMGWDAKQSRWRKTHRGRALQVRAVDLGGTNRTDTVVAANRWFREQQAKIDRELAVQTLRPNEGGYLDELESMQSIIKPLSALMRNPANRSTLAPVVESMKRRIAGINQALQKPTLPPIDDTLRNPLNIPPERIEEEARREAKQHVAERLREPIHVSPQEVENHEEAVPYDAISPDDFWDGESSGYDRVGYLRSMESIVQHNEELRERVREDRIQEEAETIAGLKDEVLVRKKKESGLIESEFDRGQIGQMLKEHGAAVPESRRLDYHIDKFLEYQNQRQAIKEIAPSRLRSIDSRIKRYREWSPIINGSVDKIGTKEHIDAYYLSLVEEVTTQKITSGYANDLFKAFKMLIDWLDGEEILKGYPRCLQRKGRYRLPVNHQEPKTVDLEWVRRILDAADPRLKLCILLTLNCGFGASEVGQLLEGEYDPKEGRITHKRRKTQKSAKTPTVCYRLWPETKELLDQAIAEQRKYPQRPEFAGCLLLNRNGKPLWYESVANGKCKRTDSISNDFDSLVKKLQTTDPDVPAIAYYQFRKTSASLIYNEPQFKTYNELWLGHAPKTIADRHYNAADRTILDDCIAWLHDKVFGVETPPARARIVKIGRV